MADGGEKRITRSQSNSTSSNSYLGFGDYLFGARARANIRSPTPSPTASPNLVPPPDVQVFFPSPESRSLPHDNTHLSTSFTPPTTTTPNMGDQAMASLSSALSGLQVSSRKPDLPPFDKNSIDKWIRRVESAYIRAGISSAREKFAFIESKFPVDEDPAVDEFLFGDPTDQNWENFCSYLRKRHGKTKRQKAAAILEPMNMDGRTPSQYFAKLKQSYDDITFDDIVKEICIRQLPPDIQQTICKDTESLKAKELMEFADKFYNPDGSRLHKKPQSVNAVKSSINAVTTTTTNNNPPTTAFSQPYRDDNNDTDEINAVRGRQSFSRGRQNGNNRSQSRPRNNNNGFGGGNNSNGNSFRSNNNGFRNNNNNGRRDDPTLCFYHNAFGDRAKKCDIGCAKAKAGNGQSPRQ